MLNYIFVFNFPSGVYSFAVDNKEIEETDSLHGKRMFIIILVYLPRHGMGLILSVLSLYLLYFSVSIFTCLPIKDIISCRTIVQVKVVLRFLICGQWLR